ncbi:zinc ribbon domain-containing protein [Haloarchaeobius amylolyticus]|uniref:zinc ribbon domain-containing protein n=1 Tax=Haloarchaeobius amylolyticus TaxID=1198296 RepID=UPI00226EB30A|nr:zinc ribbon domain-containing protein [Haloarchaeobius amylolyticus]
MARSPDPAPSTSASASDAGSATGESDSPATDAGEHPPDPGCPKCDSESVTTSQVSTTGSGLARFFDIKTRQFHVVTCEYCGYSEFYDEAQADEGTGIDAFLGRPEAGTR